MVDELARRGGVEFDAAPVEALIAQVARRATRCSAKPLTFMNASGEAVGGLLRYFKIDPADLLVVVDEVQLPLAKLRARPRGSAGGHNGLKSIIAHLGEEFSRLRIGVGRGDARRDLADHVLARFDQDEADGGRAHDGARGRCGGDVHHVGDRGGDERVQRRRSGDNRIARSTRTPCHRTGGRVMVRVAGHRDGRHYDRS